MEAVIHVVVHFPDEALGIMVKEEPEPVRVNGEGAVRPNVNHIAADALSLLGLDRAGRPLDGFPEEVPETRKVLVVLFPVVADKKIPGLREVLPRRPRDLRDSRIFPLAILERSYWEFNRKLRKSLSPLMYAYFSCCSMFSMEEPLSTAVQTAQPKREPQPLDFFIASPGDWVLITQPSPAASLYTLIVSWKSE